MMVIKMTKNVQRATNYPVFKYSQSWQRSFSRYSSTLKKKESSNCYALELSILRWKLIRKIINKEIPHYIFFPNYIYKDLSS